MDIETQKEAKEIIDIYNEFYHLCNTYPKEKWIERLEQVYGRLERKLRKIERNSTGIGNALQSKAVAYSFNEFSSIRNIITSAEYDPDNNWIERCMGFISTSRKNSMSCGSQKEVTRLALIYSLGISSRLNSIHTFTYFCDIVNRLTELPPTISSDRLKELLPDKGRRGIFETKRAEFGHSLNLAPFLDIRHLRVTYNKFMLHLIKLLSETLKC